MTIDRMIPTSLDDIYGPGAEDALGGTETTYSVRVDDGRTVEMTGMQEDLDKILAAMQAVRSEPVERLTGIDYVFGTEEHRAVGSLDLLNLLHPDTAGLVIREALDRGRQGQMDILDLARQYVDGCEADARISFLGSFKDWSPGLFRVLINALTQQDRPQ